MEPGTVRIEVAGDVAELVLDRPERRNALTGPLVEEMAAALDRLSEDPAIRVVLVRGEGGTFCSGLDLKEFGAQPPPEWVPRFSTLWSGLHGRLHRFPKPTVGALERAAIAGGSALALACDVLVVGAGAVLHVSEAELGRPAPINTVWLSLRTGPGRALATLLTAPRYSGPELVSAGLAQRCVPDEEVLPTARAVAGRMAGFDPGALRALKAGVRALEPGARFEDLVQKVTDAVGRSSS